MKTCPRCRAVLPISEFPAHRGRRSGVQAYCRGCKREYDREYHARTAETRRASTKAKKARLWGRNRDYVLAYLASHPCVDCGESDPVVLEFDHVRAPRRAHLSTMIRDEWGIERIAAEIAKCDVRCANCHRRRTARQFGWHKAIIGQ